MLRIKEIDRIRRLYYEENHSVSQIRVKLKLSRSTVYKYVNADNFNVQARKKRLSKIAEYAETIDSWLSDDSHAPKKQRHTYKRIYDRLVKEFSNFDLSYASVRKYASVIKQNLLNPIIVFCLYYTNPVRHKLISLNVFILRIISKLTNIPSLHLFLIAMRFLFKFP